VSGLCDDSAVVADDVTIYRRVPPKNLKYDARRGCNRLGSATYTDADDETSVDLGDCLDDRGVPPESALLEFSTDEGWGLVEITVADAKAVGATVYRDPLDENQCHGIVIVEGLTRASHLTLCAKSRWVVQPEGACDPPHIRIDRYGHPIP